MNLKQLAQHLNLSPTTVSRALNGYPEVNENTRARVIAAARKLNYQPSHHARKLATGKTGNIGHIISKSTHSRLGPHFADIVAGGSEACKALGYEMLLTLVDDADETRFYRELKSSGRVDGVVVNDPRVDDDRIALLSELELPFVVHGRSDAARQPYSWIDVNNLRALSRATDFLLDLGHRDIVLLNGDERWNYAARRRSGFIDAFAARGLAPPEQHMFQDDLREEYGFDVLEKLLHSDSPPTAVVASAILPAHGALRAVLQQGLTLAQDVSIITFDDQLSCIENSGEIPLFTAMRSSIRDAAARIMHLLVQRIEQPELLPTELWEAELVVGRSTGPAPA